MTKLEKIEREIETLGPDELARFREWFAEYDAAKWDAQFEADARSGRLDVLGEKASQRTALSPPVRGRMDFHDLSGALANAKS